MEKALTITWGSLWKILLMLIFASALFILKDVIIILCLALVVSSALNAPISFLEKKKFPRILATLLIFISVIVVLALLLYTIVPVAMAELGSLSGKIGKAPLPKLGDVGASKLIKSFEENIGVYTDALFSGSASFFDLVSSVFGGVIFVVMVVILSFYLSLSRDGVEKFLRAVLPLDFEAYVVDLYFRVRRKLGLWLGGQLILSFSVGLVTFLGLLSLGVNYSLILGILAGILEMVPFAGPVFSGVITFLIAISQSAILGISSIVLFVIIQQLESHVLIPLVMRRTVGLHPVVIVISILAGSQLAGFVGVILAVPAAVVIQELLEDWAIRKHSHHH
ncbi:AI-2E family transporter [Candidatus Wolfebacteria bacterium]|nr:AI-2E family transporter [Candidatus Wolfebacteria bacterium]